MSITKTKSTHEKAIILLFSNNPHDTVRQDKLNDCCANNNLEIIKIIQTNCNYDPNIFYELIEIINKCDQPITIVIGEYSYATYTQIMSCCVLATLAMTGLVNICTYWQETGSNDLRLHFVKDHFPFFLAAEEFLKQLLSIADRKLVKDTPYKNGGGQ